jgi:hypothetical protein
MTVFGFVIAAQGFDAAAGPGTESIATLRMPAPLLSPRQSSVAGQTLMEQWPFTFSSLDVNGDW